MEIKDSRIGDIVLIKYLDNVYRRKRIDKASGNHRFYETNGAFEELGDNDIWVIDTPQGNKIFSQEDILLIHKILIILGVAIVAIATGSLLAYA